MTEFEFLLVIGTFAAGFGIGVLNMAYGDPLGMKHMYRFCGLMK